MSEQDDTIADFTEIFAGLDRWAPGSPATTRRALACLPAPPEHLLEIGCGNGVATLVLAADSHARIVAIDTDDRALARLRAQAAAAGFDERIDTRPLDMTRLHALDGRFDTIWAEGSAYIAGVENALANWRELLVQGGTLVFSDLVWRTESPDAGIQAFWASDYPGMTTVASRLAQARGAGYRVVTHFDVGSEALEAYYGPLRTRLREVEGRLRGRLALNAVRRELQALDEGDGQFGYEMFVLATD